MSTASIGDERQILQVSLENKSEKWERVKKITFIGLFLIAVVMTCIVFPGRSKGNRAVSLNITDIKDTVPKVALTFDDGPSSQYTEELLDGLKQRGVKATFFVMGESAEKNPGIIARMYEEGHLIGNHTYSHVNLTTLSFEAACDEINKTNQTISNITGYTPKYIRPPYGEWDSRLLRETDMSIVLWTVDPVDWKDQNEETVASRVINSVSSGDIILLHDIFKTSVEAAFKIIDILQEKGYRFVTVDKLNSSKIIDK